MKKRMLPALISLALIFSLSWAQEKTLSKPGVLDSEEILTGQPLSRYKTVIIRDFGFEKTRYENFNKEEMERFTPLKPSLVSLLSDEFVRKLKAENLFEKVERGGEPSQDAIVLEGQFTKIDAGNRALKFWVGFGAGKSTVEVKGRLIEAATGRELALFIQDRHSPASMSDLEAVLSSDTKNLAQDLAKFIVKLYK
jgi:hypothetical protein